jgi:hypothetical protein
MRRRRPPHPRGTVIAYLWIGVFLVAFLGALYSLDDDPNTDEGAGAGALAFLVAGALTVAYLALAKRLNSHNALASSAGDQRQFAPDTRPWLRRNLGPLLGGVAAIVVIIVAPYNDPATSKAVPPERLAGVAVATVSAEANEGLHEGKVVSVDCAQTAQNGFVACAVTFEGPTCQLWWVTTDPDGKPVPIPLDNPAEGRRGRAERQTAHCEK